MRSERVFVVERAQHFAGDWPQGFQRLDAQRSNELLSAWMASGFFAERTEAEQQPAWKQLIPYCVIVRGAGQVLVVRRSSTQGETRLHGRYSIGLGGHLDPEDADGSEGRDRRVSVRRGLLRELHEELVLPANLPEPRFLGLLNDDTTDVGRVHVGLVFRLDLGLHADVQVREHHKMSGVFAPVPADHPRLAHANLGRVVETSDLWQDLDCFESWSRILLQANAWRDRDGSSPDDPAANRSEVRIYDGGSENPQAE